MPTVKTIISIEHDLLVKVGELANTLKVSRSRVFAIAAEGLLNRQGNQTLLERINAAHESEPDPEDAIRLTASRRSFRERVEGEW